MCSQRRYKASNILDKLIDINCTQFQGTVQVSRELRREIKQGICSLGIYLIFIFSKQFFSSKRILLYLPNKMNPPQYSPSLGSSLIFHYLQK